MNRALVAVCLVLGAVAIGLVTYRQVIHEHAPAVIFIKTDRACDCSDEFRDIRYDVWEAREMAKGAMAYTTHFGIYANSLFQRIEKIEVDWREGSAQMRVDIEAAKTWCKQNKPKCGSW